MLHHQARPDIKFASSSSSVSTRSKKELCSRDMVSVLGRGPSFIQEKKSRFLMSANREKERTLVLNAIELEHIARARRLKIKLLQDDLLKS